MRTREPAPWSCDAVKPYENSEDEDHWGSVGPQRKFDSTQVSNIFTTSELPFDTHSMDREALRLAANVGEAREGGRKLVREEGGEFGTGS
jgi:hypothetical protein